MKKHQLIFTDIKQILKKYFPGKIDECEDGQHLSIADSGIWISSDDRELTVGNGLVHQHYDPEFDNLETAVAHFFNLLTCRTKRTDFFKGKFAYKHKIELELPDGTHENLGTAMTWLFPFWKRTTEKITYKDGLVSIDEIQSDLLSIKKLCTKAAKNPQTNEPYKEHLKVICPIYNAAAGGMGRFVQQGKQRGLLIENSKFFVKIKERFQRAKEVLVAMVSSTENIGNHGVSGIVC